MNKKRIGIFIALLAMVCMGLRAQSATSLRINEVLVVNDQNYQDDYGLHNAWIEIFNTSFASVNLEGCFLTNDKNNPTKYPIPKGDVLTLIKPRQHALFWADGMPNRGTFHVNFTLDPNKENYIALYDSNGKTLIDEVTIPAGQLADRSYAREKDGSANWVCHSEHQQYDYRQKPEDRELQETRLYRYRYGHHRHVGRIHRFGTLVSFIQGGR